MTVCLLTFAGDIAQTIALLEWIGELGGCRNHDLVLVADAGTPFDLASRALELGRVHFKTAKIITNKQSVKGWPAGCWSLFQTAIHHATEPFLILEPDAIPLKSGWLDFIGSAYRPGTFLGNIYDCKQPFMPERLMSGIAVYPANTKDLFPPIDTPQHWDVYGAGIMVANGADTPLIRHYFGQKDLPPFFVREKHPNSPANALTMDSIPSDCVLWHRDKTHSLIRLMRGAKREKITVCFNVHAGDIALAITHSVWLRKMGARHEHKAIICHDPSCPVTSLNQLETNLRAVFTDLETLVYSRPPILGYPQAANWAFQSIALHMAAQKSPWFFFEADGIALKPDWLEQLQEEYDGCGASWMGPVVPHMGHLQGTAIYPHDAAQRMPRAMQTGEREAFDMAGRDETIHDRHDASHLMFHLWSLVNRMAHPVGGGEVPTNITASEISRWLPKSAVYVHRIKDDSALRLLISGEFKP